MTGLLEGKDTDELAVSLGSSERGRKGRLLNWERKSESIQQTQTTQCAYQESE